MVSARLVSSNKLRVPSEAENSVTLQEERDSLAAEPLVFVADQLPENIDTDPSLSIWRLKSLILRRGLKLNLLSLFQKRQHL